MNVFIHGGSDDDEDDDSDDDEERIHSLSLTFFVSLNVFSMVSFLFGIRSKPNLRWNNNYDL